MSVDDRLREAFAETDPTWDDRTAAALREVTVRERRERITRRTAVTMAAAAATAAVVLVVANPGDRDEVPAPEPTPTPTTEVANPLDGFWVSEPVTRADVRRAARLAGDASAAATMLDELRSVPFRVTMTIDGDRNALITHVRYGDEEELMDEENAEVDGDRVRFTPQFADGDTVHGWSLADGALRLTFVSTTEATENGVPAEAWQRLIYDTAAFTPGT